ncbi:ATP-binding cassette domain-containing protein [Olivibacter sitiensis]|uniref:ABC transporter ATP-binding protein n=1 Tax=Olivibacter sitiensis TaxID=376470 RepID=UPI000402D811|nr:ABC transporter ATP-binding protein [Olivibacter sitiensis]
MISLSHLSFGYKKKKLLFEDLNLQLSPGHIYGLLGKNGAGKTSLLKNIAGLSYPKAGTCSINTMTPKRRQPAFLQQLYYLAEEIYVPDTKAKDFVKGTAPFYPNFDHEQLNAYLTDFEVPQDSKLTHLSLGQQKKFMIAFALACNTQVLIMDEPTNGLDIPSKAKFRKVIANAFSDDRCILISTHQVRDLDNLIDSVLILHDRRIVLNKSYEDLGKQLYFGLFDQEIGGKSLYAEETYRGTLGIATNDNNWNSKPDLELLFNAVISDNQSLIHHLNQQPS